MNLLIDITGVQLKTERLLLRPLGRGDLESTHAYASDGDNARYMLFLPNDTVAETEAFLQRVSDEWAKEKPVSYEFAVVRDGEHIGAVSVELMEDGISAEMGWVFRRDCQKQGYAYEAALAVRNRCPLCSVEVGKLQELMHFREEKETACSGLK